VLPLRPLHHQPLRRLQLLRVRLRQALCLRDRLLLNRLRLVRLRQLRRLHRLARRRRRRHWFLRRILRPLLPHQQHRDRQRLLVPLRRLQGQQRRLRRLARGLEFRFGSNRRNNNPALQWDSVRLVNDRLLQVRPAHRYRAVRDHKGSRGKGSGRHFVPDRARDNISALVVHHKGSVQRQEARRARVGHLAPEDRHRGSHSVRAVAGPVVQVQDRRP
jgi:hypothetical protein